MTFRVEMLIIPVQKKRLHISFSAIFGKKNGNKRLSVPTISKSLLITKFLSQTMILARANEGTDIEAQDVGWDMSCPRNLFLDERKSLL